jgi:hypothetical protein
VLSYGVSRDRTLSPLVFRQSGRVTSHASSPPRPQSTKYHRYNSLELRSCAPKHPCKQLILNAMQKSAHLTETTNFQVPLFSYSCALFSCKSCICRSYANHTGGIPAQRVSYQKCHLKSCDSRILDAFPNPAPICGASAICSRLAPAVGTLHSPLATRSPAIALAKAGHSLAPPKPWRRRATLRRLQPQCS